MQGAWLCLPVSFSHGANNSLAFLRKAWAILVGGLLPPPSSQGTQAWFTSSRQGVCWFSLPPTLSAPLLAPLGVTRPETRQEVAHGDSADTWPDCRVYSKVRGLPQNWQAEGDDKAG